MQEYQKALEQITNLKKQSSSLKLTIQKIRAQLNGQKQLKQQLIKKCESQQKRIQEGNKKITQLQQQQNHINDLYEDQIVQLKTLVQMKSKELQQISLKILPNFDQDMIRIKILNQLELPHREEIEDMADQIKKLHAHIIEVEKNKQILQEKFKILQKNHDQQKHLLEKKHITELEKSSKQMAEIINKDNTHRQNNKKLRREIQQLKSKLNNIKRSHQDTLEQMEKENKQKSNTYQIQFQVKSMQKDIQNKNTQMKFLKEENSKLKNDLQKLKQDYSKITQKIIQKDQAISQLKEINVKYQQKLEQLKNQEKVIEELNQKLKNYKKQNDLAKEQNISDNNRIQFLQKELSQAYETIRLNKHNSIQELSNKKEIFTKPSIDEQQNLNELTKLKTENLNLIQRLTIKQKQTQKIITQLEQIKRGRSSSNKARERETDMNIIQNLKNKLKQANKKIVELIKEKIELSKTSERPNPRMSLKNY